MYVHGSKVRSTRRALFVGTAIVAAVSLGSLGVASAATHEGRGFHKTSRHVVIKKPTIKSSGSSANAKIAADEMAVQKAFKANDQAALDTAISALQTDLDAAVQARLAATTTTTAPADTATTAPATDTTTTVADDTTTTVADDTTTTVADDTTTTADDATTDTTDPTDTSGDDTTDTTDTSTDGTDATDTSTDGTDSSGD